MATWCGTTLIVAYSYYGYNIEIVLLLLLR